MAAITPVGIGAAPNDGNGDPLRTAFTLINANEAALNAELIAATTQAAANLALINGLGALAALDSVTAAQIDAGAVDTSELANLAVTAAKIAADT
ncbi:MAG: hypothetical protein ACR2QF_17610, partial [Geminicoccaceae bacterium]